MFVVCVVAALHADAQLPRGRVVGNYGHRPGRDTFWLAVCPAIAAEMVTCVVESFVEWGRRLAYDC